MTGSKGNTTNTNRRTHQPNDTERTTSDRQTTLPYHEYYETPADTCPRGRLPHDSDLREALTRKKLLKLQHLTRKTWAKDYPHLAHYLPTEEECEFTRYRTKRDVQAARAIDRNTEITHTSQTTNQEPNPQQTTSKQTQKTPEERERKAAYDRTRRQNLPQEGKQKRALYERKRREEATAHETPEEKAARKMKEANRVRLYRQKRTRDSRSVGRETDQTPAPKTSNGRKRCNA